MSGTFVDELRAARVTKRLMVSLKAKRTDEETAAIDAAKRMRRKALRPKQPINAQALFKRTMDAHTRRVQSLVERYVLSLIPEGDGQIDVAAIEAGLVKVESELEALMRLVLKPARRCAIRVSEHTRKEAQRLFGVNQPALRQAEASRFTERVLGRLRAAGTGQVTAIRRLLHGKVLNRSLRQAISDSLWITRERARLVNADECHRLFINELCTAAIRSGSEKAVYITARDERVRESHRALDGVLVDWSNPPSTLMEPNCRCVLAPLQGRV